MKTTIQKQVSLASRNWFKTGGKAAYFAEPTSKAALAEVLKFAAAKKLPIALLGEGANTLISDEGFKGMVISPKNTGIKILSEKKAPIVRAGAGAAVDDVVNFALKHKAKGLEEFSALPGTIGGAAFINAHYFEYFLADFLVSATVCDYQGNFQTVDSAWFEYGYDVSKLHRENWIIWTVDLKLSKASEIETAFAQGRAFEIKRQRSRRYPQERTCGSFFRNFLPEEVPEGASKSIAFYLDRLGVKGNLSIGGASVSRKHANMLETKKGAKARDIIALARLLQEMVFENFGLVPVPECRFLGFKKFPLHTAKTLR